MTYENFIDLISKDKIVKTIEIQGDIYRIIDEAKENNDTIHLYLMFALRKFILRVYKNGSYKLFIHEALDVPIKVGNIKNIKLVEG